MPKTTQKVTVRTTVTIPDLECDGLVKGGRPYIDQEGLAAWLYLTADSFDEAHADADIGKSIRLCARVIDGAKVS